MALMKYRRHKSTCRHFGTEREQSKSNCKCTIYVKGSLNHQYVRRSMDLTDWDAATRQIAEWVKAGSLSGALAKQQMSVAGAVDEYLSDLKYAGKGESTVTKFTLLLKDRLVPFCKTLKITQMIDVTDVVANTFRKSWRLTREQEEAGIAELDPYEPGRELREPIGLKVTKNYQTQLKKFFTYCVGKNWLVSNPAAGFLKITPPDTQEQPFEPEEVDRIIAACKSLVHKPCHRYNRANRALAMVLILRWTGLRFGDVATLKWSEVADGWLDRIAQKNKARIQLQLSEPIQQALYDSTGQRQRFSGSDKYIFWTGFSDMNTARTSCGTMLDEVYELAGVEGAHAHRFRHTFVVEALKHNVPMEDIAEAIGDDVATVQKFYSSFVPARRKLMNDRLAAIPGFSATPAPPALPLAFPHLVPAMVPTSRTGTHRS